MAIVKINDVDPENVTDHDVEVLTRYTTYLGLLCRCIELADLIEPHAKKFENNKNV